MKKEGIYEYHSPPREKKLPFYAMPRDRGE
jgi:hypothetical protein